MANKERFNLEERTAKFGKDIIKFEKYINHEIYEKHEKKRKWKMKELCTSGSMEISTCSKVILHKKGMSFP